MIIKTNSCLIATNADVDGRELPRWRKLGDDTYERVG